MMIESVDRKVILFIFMLFLTCPLYCQVKLAFVNDHTNLPVEGIIIGVENTTNGRSFSAISDNRGEALFPELLFPFKIEASHVSYGIVTQLINSHEELTIRLIEKNIDLGQLIITGQHQPQAIDKAVFTVKSIDQKRIVSQGALDLADVLSNNLNITVNPSKSEGRTTISMLGLSGQYVKILVDGMPFVGVEGNGNNVDISQINLNTIERIEIVEGPMAVSYGANAMAGVINLITKKGITQSISIQEETVGSEYGLNQGRHVQTVDMGFRASEKFTVRTDFQRNDFRGFRGNFLGEDHLEEDGRRGFDWHPKRQYSSSASLGFRANQHKFSYRFNYFHQQLDRLSATVFPDEHPATGIKNPYAFDEENTTKRFLHQLNISSALGRISFDINTAYTGVDLSQNTFRKRLLSGNTEESISDRNSLFNSLTSRGNFTNFLKSDQLSLELGYEYTGEKVRDENIDGGERRIDNLALFSSLEWSVLDRLKIRPGLRLMNNSSFKTPLIYSLNIKYLTPSDFDIRASFGRSYRTPNLTELYYFFVDANHDVRGNANLTPEDGYGTSLDIKKRLSLGQANVETNLKLFYNDLSNQITLGVVNELPLQFQYINIEKFRSKGVTFSNNFSFKSLSVNAGISYIGRYNQFTEEQENQEKFLFSPEFNLNATYNILNDKINVSLFYKHTGIVEQYVFDQELGDYRKGKTNSFNWLDLTTSWKITKQILLNTGVKNILNISDIQTNTGASGTHSDAPTNVGLSYGRSYFLRMNYTF